MAVAQSNAFDNFTFDQLEATVAKVQIKRVYEQPVHSPDGNETYMVDSFTTTLYMGADYDQAAAVYKTSQSNEKSLIQILPNGAQHVIRKHRYQLDV